MGNTKYIWFAGEFKQDVEITEAKLIEWAHGTYACLKEDADGYLGLGKNVKWVQGLVHTYSMTGANLIEYLQLKMVHGSIGLHDATQDWYVYYDIYDGEIEAQKAISLSSVPVRFPFTLNDLAQPNWTLNKPLTVTVEQYIQKETTVCFEEAHIYGYGDSIPQALNDLAKHLIGQFEFLLEEEKRVTLGPLPQKQLGTLKSYLQAR